MSSNSGITGELTKRERDDLLKEFVEIAEKLKASSQGGPRIPRRQIDALDQRITTLKSEYFNFLPKVVLSRCPYCQQPLSRRFDIWSLNGFWWQDKEPSVPFTEAPHCEHFAFLQGAVNLNGLPPEGGWNASHPGPEVPFVIPAVLELPTMMAVISSVPLDNGYTAYPIAYFAQQQPQGGQLANAWTETTYGFIDPDTGEKVWTICEDPWDFDLLPWLDQKKLMWISVGDPKWELHSQPREDFPYQDLPGLRELQIIKGTSVQTTSPPSGDEDDDDEDDPFD